MFLNVDKASSNTGDAFFMPFIRAPPPHQRFATKTIDEVENGEERKVLFICRRPGS